MWWFSSVNQCWQIKISPKKCAAQKMLDSISREKKDSFESNTNNKSTDMCFEYKGTHLKFIPYEFINDRVLFCCIAVNFEERMKKNIRFNVFEIESRNTQTYTWNGLVIDHFIGEHMISMYTHVRLTSTASTVSFGANINFWCFWAMNIVVCFDDFRPIFMCVQISLGCWLLSQLLSAHSTNWSKKLNFLLWIFR